MHKCWILKSLFAKNLHTHMSIKLIISSHSLASQKVDMWWAMYQSNLLFGTVASRLK